MGTESKDLLHRTRDPFMLRALAEKPLHGFASDEIRMHLDRWAEEFRAQGMSAATRKRPLLAGSASATVFD